MLKKYETYLNDIKSAINSIENFTKGITAEQFKRDDKTSSAVIRKLEIIGEATKHIPNDIREKYTQIPWKEMAGMRDKLIHTYSEVDLNLVWKTIKNRIPELKSFIIQLNENNSNIIK
jgi:uncharacterized protein with HEPN domain